MKITKNRQEDLKSIIFFIPQVCEDIKITEKDIEMFFENSENGLHWEKVRPSHFNDGFNALIQGKRWRGIHMQMWEEGIIDGSVLYVQLLLKDEKFPEYVIDFMKKEMFKGADAEIIDKILSQK